MALQINELIINTKVTGNDLQPQGRQEPLQNNSGKGCNQSSQEGNMQSANDELVNTCVKKVLDILEWRKEY